MNLNRRRALLTIGVMPIVLSGCITGDEPKLTGTDLGKTQSPDFTLTDQRGDSIQLSALKGTTVVLTFIYTNCPDICPVTASNIRATYEQLSEKLRESVAFLAITVDPERDTPEVLTEFSTRFGLDTVPQWHALTGTRAELETVWIAYGIDPGAIAEEVEAHLNGTGRPYLLSHTDAVYLINSKGQQRTLLRSSFDPEALAQDIDTLSK